MLPEHGIHALTSLVAVEELVAEGLDHVIEGDREAQFGLGVLYHTGKGIKKNYAKALHWYRKSARQGNPKAANNLGNMYRKGLGVVRDRAEALIWYRKAARLGHGDLAGKLRGRVVKAMCGAKGHHVSLRVCGSSMQPLAP